MGASKAEGTRGMTRLHVPQAWRETAATILRDRPRVILVLGGGDAGKSSFCRFLLAELLAAGHRVAVVDSDLGQKDIGPPATVTLGYSAPRCGQGLPAEGPLEQGPTVARWPPAAEAFYFVGSTSPVGRMLPLLVGTARLVRVAEAPFVLVDTTGYVEGAGRVLKGYKIESVRPDLVVCMGFPWKVPADALAVPPLGWLNGHPSLLPHRPGPVPVAWAIREGAEQKVIGRQGQLARLKAANPAMRGPRRRRAPATSRRMPTSTTCAAVTNRYW